MSGELFAQRVGLAAHVREDMAVAFATPSVGAATVAVCDAAEAWLAQGLAQLRPWQTPLVALWSAGPRHFSRAHAEAVVAVTGGHIVDVEGGYHWLVWHDPARVSATLGLRVSCCTSR